MVVMPRVEYKAPDIYTEWLESKHIKKVAKGHWRTKTRKLPHVGMDKLIVQIDPNKAFLEIAIFGWDYDWGTNPDPLVMNRRRSRSYRLSAGMDTRRNSHLAATEKPEQQL